MRNSHVTHVYDFTVAYQGPKGLQDASDLAMIHACPHLGRFYRYRCHIRR